MKHRITVLWIHALRGSGRAYRKLGVIYARGGRTEQALSKACLEKSMEMGDENSFFIYHRYFCKGRQVIDDISYEAMASEYLQTLNLEKKRKLRKYLEMGTSRQRKKYNVKTLNNRRLYDIMDSE